MQYEEGSEIPEDRIATLRPGVTTRGEVLAWFGAPETFTNTSVINKMMEDYGMSPKEVLELPFADAMVFRFSRGRMRGLVLGVWNRMDLRVTTDTLVVFFDAEDRVSAYGYRRGTDELDDEEEAAERAARSPRAKPPVLGGAAPLGAAGTGPGSVGADAIANP